MPVNIYESNLCKINYFFLTGLTSKSFTFTVYVKAIIDSLYHDKSVS